MERDGERRILYYECGVVALEYSREFCLEWQELWVEFRDWVKRDAPSEIGGIVERQRAAFEGIYERTESEVYALVLTPGAGGWREEREPLARLVRRETRPLSEEEANEVWRGAISYHPEDLLVVGWEAALVAGGTEEVSALLRYANVQLLEFRRYDAQLSALLGSGYGELRRFRRWRLRSKAEETYRMLIEIRESAERLDGAVKFLSDSYAARVHRLAAGRIGVDDYRRLVDEKMKVAQEVYRFMVDEFHHTRAFVLEATVVAILLIDLYYLLRGKL